MCKILCFCGSLIRSIQSFQIYTTACRSFRFRKDQLFLYTLYITKWDLLELLSYMKENIGFWQETLANI